MTAARRTLIVLITDPEIGLLALDWAIAESADRPTILDVVITGSDTPGAPQYVSPRAHQTITDRLQACGVMHRVHLEDRDPADLALTRADKVGAELIVLAVRRRSATAKFLLGSTAQRVLTAARCPVVVVKP